MDNTNSNENVLPTIQTNPVFYALVILIVFLVIALILIYFKVNIFLKKGKSNQETQNIVLTTFFFCLIVICLSGFLLPNFKDIKKLFTQITSVSYAILYTMGLILFFGFMPSWIINEYAYIILPIIAVVGGFVFYQSASHSYVDEFNVNYERIKSVLLFLCVMTIFIILYYADPGEYISTYIGGSFLLAILIGVFALLYLIIVITLPDNPSKGKNANTSLLNKFSTITNYIGFGYILFLIMFGIMLYSDTSGASSESTSAFFVIGFIISILWGLLVVVNTFPGIVDKGATSSKLTTLKNSLLIVFAIVISSLFIAWISTTIQDYSGQSNIAYLILNIAIVVIVLGLIYRTIQVPLPLGNNQKNGFINLVTSMLFYIPCLFNGVFDSIGKVFTGDYKGEAGSLLMLVVAILLFIVYFRMPSVFNIIETQGGKQLVNKPVNTHSEYALGTYKDLNESEEYDYQYGLSFWVFLHAAPPSMNPNYNKYTSLLNFGGKPNVLYNGSTNTLMVTISQEDGTQTEKNQPDKLTDYTENGDRILYRNNNVLLQKWNNIIINYSGGVLDIFLNGELVKSNIGVVPYYRLDNLTIGSSEGIEGGICNVVYFRKPLTMTNIYYLYNMVKDRTPPVLNESNTTILVKNMNQVSNAIK